MTKKRKFYKKAKVNENNKKQLPSISRTIPDKLKNDHLVFLGGILCILTAILIVSFDLYSNYKLQRQLTNEKIKVLNEMVFWQNEMKSRPDYRDGYFSLALLNFQLKDFDKASENLQKAMILDPNFEKGRELESLLENVN